MSIRRIDIGERMSQAVVCNGVVTTAGIVAQTAPGESVGAQTRDILNRIDALLAEAGTDKSKLLSGMIWITDMAAFDDMNAVWDTWVTPGATPVRACVEARLASPKFAVEIQVTAAVE